MLAATSLVLWIPACAESAAGNTTVSGKENVSDADCEKSGQGESDTAEETGLKIFIRDSGQKKADAVIVSGLRITVEEEAEADLRDHGKSQGDTGSVPEPRERAAVISAEGIRWEIPLFWTDGSNTLAEKREPGRDYRPVLAFFVPEEYAVQKDAEDRFTVTLDLWLSGLYEAAGGAICFYEPRTNITYILAAGSDLSFLEKEAGKLPVQPIPGLPGELQKPADGTYRNPSSKAGKPLPEREKENGGKADDGEVTGGRPGKSAGQRGQDSAEETEPPEKTDQSDAEEYSSQKEELPQADGHGGSEDTAEQEQTQVPLTREQLLAHCAANTLDKYGEDEMANLVDLIINCIQPQAVNLIKTKFPAFARAAEEGELGKEIGLYVYRMYGEKDGVKAHEDTSLQALAYVSYHIDKDEKGKAQLGYVLGLNTFYFQSRDKDGNLQIDTSEQAAADLDNSIIHEMFHAFMCDYNRTGTIGTREPEDYLNSAKELQETREVYAFPEWFREGIASAVENVYQYRYEYFQLLRYEGEGRIGDRHTGENLLNTYLSRHFLLENEEEYEDSYDIGAEEETSTSAYVTGYLADLFLGELAARHESISSVRADGNGSKTVSSESIRLGLDSILSRLHKGETLDEIIRSISDGRYKDVRDFEQKFIKGTDQKGDQESISFCVDFLNYMQDIRAAGTYIPNGSVLFDFDREYTTPIDRSVTVKTDLYRITDSSDYTASTVRPETPYTDGGKSLPEDSAAGASDPLAEAGSSDDQNIRQAAKEENTFKEKENHSGLQEGSFDPAQASGQLETVEASEKADAGEVSENASAAGASENPDEAEEESAVDETEELTFESESAEPLKEESVLESGPADCTEGEVPAADETGEG